MRRTWTTILAATLAAASAWAMARDGSREPRVRASRPTGGTPTIGYDAGTPADFFRGFEGVNRSIGNQFDTRNGNPLMAGTLTAVTVFPAAADGNGTFTVFGPPTGSAARVLGVFYASGLVDSTFNQVPLTLTVGSSFLVGMYVGADAPGSIGMNAATVAGQGYHGMRINVGDRAFGTGFQTLDGENAMIRASGTVVPVELMAFEVE